MPSEWDAAAKGWDAEAGETGVWYQRTIIDKVVLRLVGPVRGKRVLEIGCGNGYMSRRLARRGAKALGVDVSRKMIEYAIKREEAAGTGAKFKRMDASKFQFPRGTKYDIVVSGMCLMDVRDGAGVIRRAGSVLRRGGKMVLSIVHPMDCDFTSHWHITRSAGRKRFGRFVWRYLSCFAERSPFPIPGHPNFMSWDYHRSVDWYMNRLFEAGLSVTGFVEIPAVRKVMKAKAGDGDVTFRRTRYRTLAEKRMKETAGRELPLFLAIRAEKK